MPSRIPTPLITCAPEDVAYRVKLLHKRREHAPRVAAIVCSQNEKGKIGVCLVRHEKGGSLMTPSGKLSQSDDLKVATRRMLGQELNINLPNAIGEWSPCHILGKFFLHDVPERAPTPFTKGKAYFLTTQWVASPKDVKKLLPMGAENQAIELQWLYDLRDIRHAMADVRDENKREALVDAITESMHHWFTQLELQKQQKLVA